jgi:putative metallohydrolase (TIGR04338 family)
MDQLQKQLGQTFGFNATAAVKARKRSRGTLTGKRDSQRRKLYEADWSFHDAHPELRLGSFEEVEAFATHVMERERRKFHHERQRAISEKAADTCRILRNGRRNGAAHVYHLFRGSRIEFGPGSFHKATVLHELAHHYAPRAEKHGREFARVYVELVRRYLGSNYARELRERFRARGVKHTRPRKLSAQALEAARARGRALAEMNRAKREAKRQAKRGVTHHQRTTAT